MTKVIIEVSARHCHLSPRHLAKLFGSGYQLSVLKELSQTGQYAAKETVTLKTKEGTLERLRVVGPIREKTQVEISRTEARQLKINPPVRLSGNLNDSLGGVLIGPKGQVKIIEGIIIAKRHIHCDPKTAKKLGLSQKYHCTVKSAGDRSVVFNNISVRIKENFVFRMHIDTDEGNAALQDGVCGYGEFLSKKSK